MKQFLSRKISLILLILGASGFVFSQNNPPPGLTATQSGTTVSLSWTNIDETPNLNGYIVFARVDAGAYPTIAVAGANDHDLTNGNGRTQVTGESSNSFSSFTVAPGTKYDFIIYSYRGSSLSPDSTYATITTASLATAPGAFPGAFTFTATAGSSDITLNFTKASLLPMGAHGYALLRRVSSNPTGAGLNDANAPAGTYFIHNINDSLATSYTDNTAAVGTTYHYALVPYRVTFNTGVPIPETYKYGTLSSIPTATIAATVDVVALSGGIKANPLSSTDTNVALLGFSADANATSNFNSINIQVSSTPNLKLTNIRLLRTATATYTGTGTPVGSVNASSGTHIAVTAIGQNVNTIQYFFLVADVVPTVTSATDSIQASFDEGDMTFSLGNALPASITGAKYGFIDETLPTITTLTPANNSTGISVNLPQVSAVFSEPVVDNLSTTVAGRMVRLKIVGGAFVDTLTLNSNIGNTVIFNLHHTLLAGTDYAIQIGNTAFADTVGNGFAGISNETSWRFQTESSPTITSFNPSPICVSDSVTVNGTGFGTIKPKVTVNGVDVPAANVRYISSTQTRFQVPATATTGKIRITNLQNNLPSAVTATNLVINEAINTGLTVSPTTTAALVGNSINITVNNTQSSSFSYLLRRVLPTAGNVGASQAGNGGTRTFTSDVFSSPVTYTYQIQVSSTNCTSKILTNTVSVSVSSLSVYAGADQAICSGDSVRIGGNPTGSGGNGFIMTSWTSNPGTFTSNNPNPYVKPTVTTRYFVVVKDSDGLVEAKDTVRITVNAAATARFLSQDSVKTNFTDQDSVYLLSNKVKVTPAGGTYNFTGLGVSKHADGKFYFDPKTVGTQNDMPITFTYTIGGCVKTDEILVDVAPANAVIGIDNFYCSNLSQSSVLTHNPAFIPATYNGGTYRYTYTFSRLGFYNCSVGFINPPDTRNPLISLGSGQYRLDIQKIVNTNYPSNCFYVMVYATIQYEDLLFPANNSSYETYVGYNYFELSYIRQIPEIATIRESQNICSDGNSILLETNMPTYTTNNWTINDGSDNSIVFSGGDYSFDPTEISFGPPTELVKSYTITYDYNDDNPVPSGGCRNTVTRNLNVIRKLAAPVADDKTYCQFYTGARNLNVSSYRDDLGVILNWYDGTSLDFITNGTNLDTQISTATPGNKTYRVTQSYFGCESLPDDANVIITPATAVNLTIPPQCEDRTATFKGPTASVTSWLWDLGDGTTSTDSTVNHIYPNPGVYTVSLDIVSNVSGQVCSSSDKIAVTVGQNPKPNFSYKFLCSGDGTQFIASSDIPTNKYQWYFSTGASIPAGDSLTVPPAPFGGVSYKKPIYTLPGPGSYDVWAKTITNLGCYDSLKKTITILPRMTGTYDMATAPGAAGGWTLDNVSTNSTFQYAATNKPIIKSTTPAWVTNPTGVYLENDRSYINSPCFNFSGVARPVLSIDYASNTPVQVDGAALEYSVDGGVTWVTLGTLGSGLEWYNTPGFVLGNIGSSSRGWSGDIYEAALNPFKSGKHALDGISNPANTRFRIAFASGSGDKTTFDGFAFKNVKIESRNRLMLAENFTQTGFGTNNTTFASIPNSEAVKLEYHMSFPTEDDLNLRNTEDPGSRGAFYGITNATGIIPRGYIDGYSEGSYASAWNHTVYRNLRSLSASPVSIDITTQVGNEEELTFQVDVDSISPIGADKHPVLYVAIVEKSVIGGNFVVLKMLPNAAGTELTRPVSYSNTFVWRPNDSEFTRGEIAIAAFVQDKYDKEVYQAYINLTPDINHVPDPSLITGTEDDEYAKRITLYPNPANHEVNIQLPAAVNKSTPIEMYDAFGRIVYQSAFNAGEKTKTVSTSNFADGIYMLQLITPQGSKVVRKVMVTHR